MILIILLILGLVFVLWGEKIFILEERLYGFVVIMFGVNIGVVVLVLLSTSLYTLPDINKLNKAEQYSLIDYKKAGPELKQKIYNCIKQYNQEIKELQEKNKSILYDLFIHDSITNVKPIILPKDASEKKD
jgi:hypothetical protein